MSTTAGRPLPPETAPLVLASASPSRRQLLLDAGVRFRVVPSAVDEAALRRHLDAGAMPLADMALALACEKALSVSRDEPDSLVLGADQMLECDGRRLDKAADMAEARRHLEALQGRTHRLVTATVLVANGERRWHHTATAVLTMRSLDEESLTAYIAAAGERILASVGCYQVEGRGIRLFERIEGDWHAIIGLPLLAVLNELDARGALGPWD
ncbi:MAG: septum formation protein Maf [Alphaproteobacteria bacterium]|nr:septum formation protein Maf [Alphaproteobacteria bacterium]